MSEVIVAQNTKFVLTVEEAQRRGKAFAAEYPKVTRIGNGRLERAIEIASTPDCITSHEEIMGAYDVRSAPTKNWYVVHPSQHTCTCPDHQKTEGAIVCKHRLAVSLVTIAHSFVLVGERIGRETIADLMDMRVSLTNQMIACGQSVDEVGMTETGFEAGKVRLLIAALTVSKMTTLIQFLETKTRTDPSWFNQETAKDACIAAAERIKNNDTKNGVVV